MTLEFEGEIWFWRGPAPWYFVSVPEGEAAELRAIVSRVTYGWGMIPVLVTIGGTSFETALWPKDGGYIVPIKASVRMAEKLVEGDVVSVLLEVSIELD